MESSILSLCGAGSEPDVFLAFCCCCSHALPWSTILPRYLQVHLMNQFRYQEPKEPRGRPFLSAELPGMLLLWSRKTHTRDQIDYPHQYLLSDQEREIKWRNWFLEGGVSWCVNMVSFRHHEDMDYGIFLLCHCVYPLASLCFVKSRLTEEGQLAVAPRL